MNARLDAYGGTALFLAPGLRDLKASNDSIIWVASNALLQKSYVRSNVIHLVLTVQGPNRASLKRALV